MRDGSWTGQTWPIQTKHCSWTAKDAKHAENPLIFFDPRSRHAGGSRRLWTVIRFGFAEECYPFAVSATFAVKYLGSDDNGERGRCLNRRMD
jgi:hypothetical protein